MPVALHFFSHATPPGAAGNVPFRLRDWEALAPGLDSPAAWQAWAQEETPFPPNDTAPRLSSRIPMMTARRLSTGARFAVHATLGLLEKHPATALVFSSRHGEIERTLHILRALADGTEISPTDFAMSVHNTAVGQLTITARRPLPASSVAAGAGSFHQALFEVQAFLAAGHDNVLHIDFETRLPDVYHAHATPVFPAYAAAFLWEKTAPPAPLPTSLPATSLPASLAFLRAHLRDERPRRP